MVWLNISTMTHQRDVITGVLIPSETTVRSS
jgi:hypothetical protein